MSREWSAVKYPPPLLMTLRAAEGGKGRGRTALQASAEAEVVREHSACPRLHRPMTLTRCHKARAVGRRPLDACL